VFYTARYDATVSVKKGRYDYPEKSEISMVQVVSTGVETIDPGNPGRAGILYQEGMEGKFHLDTYMVVETASDKHIFRVGKVEEP